MKSLPSKEELWENFTYDPDTGHFERIKFGHGKRKSRPFGAGKNVTLNRVRYKKHRVIWKMMTGKDPEDTVDHHDGNELNNKWINLRIADHHGQMRNSKQHPGRSGHFGVGYSEKYSLRWRARIKVNGKFIYIGRYKTMEEAVAARREAEQKYHGEFALSNRPK